MLHGHKKQLDMFYDINKSKNTIAVYKYSPTNLQYKIYAVSCEKKKDAHHCKTDIPETGNFQWNVCFYFISCVIQIRKSHGTIIYVAGYIFIWTYVICIWNADAEERLRKSFEQKVRDTKNFRRRKLKTFLNHAGLPRSSKSEYPVDSRGFDLSWKSCFRNVS